MKKVHILYIFNKETENKKLVSVFTTKKRADYYASQLNKHLKVNNFKYVVESEYLNRISFNYEILPFELYNPKK
jgi:hypothetical protein